MSVGHLTNSLLILVFIASATITDAQDPSVSYYAEAISSQLTLNFTETTGLVSGSLFWFRTPRGSTNPIILYSCTIGTGGDCNNIAGGTEYVLEFNPPEYNLHINELNTVTSTKYTVTTSTSTSGSQLTYLYFTIALEPLTCPQTVYEVADGTQMEISCVSSYYQYLLEQDMIQYPELQWSNDLGTDFSGQVDPNVTDLYTTSTLNVTLTPEFDDVPFTCNLTFPADTGIDYVDSCEVTYYVIHGVSSVDTGLDTSAGIPTLIVGDVLNCTANGRPLPTIIWRDESGVLVSDTEVLDITNDMTTLTQPVTYSCVASNNIDGIFYEESSNVTFYVSLEVITQSGGVEAWVIAVAVCVPLVVIIAGGIGGYFFYRHRKEKKDKKKKSGSTNGTSASAYSAVNTNPDPYPARAPVNTIYSAPVAAQRNMTPPTASGATTPGGAGGYGALGVQYYTGSNNALNASINSNAPSNRPAYPYNPRQGVPAVSLNPNPSGRPTPLPPAGNPTYPYAGRQASVASSASSRSSYQPTQPIPAPPNFVPPYRPSQASSVSGSEV